MTDTNAVGSYVNLIDFWKESAAKKTSAAHDEKCPFLNVKLVGDCPEHFYPDASREHIRCPVQVDQTLSLTYRDHRFIYRNVSKYGTQWSLKSSRVDVNWINQVLRQVAIRLTDDVQIGSPSYASKNGILYIKAKLSNDVMTVDGQEVVGEDQFFATMTMGSMNRNQSEIFKSIKSIEFIPYVWLKYVENAAPILNMTLFIKSIKTVGNDQEQ